MEPTTGIELRGGLRSCRGDLRDLLDGQRASLLELAVQMTVGDPGTAMTLAAAARALARAQQELAVTP